MKRICTILFAAILVVVLMGCSMSLSAASEQSSPSSQVLASVGKVGDTPTENSTASVGSLQAIGVKDSFASTFSVAAGVVLIFVGCTGLYLLEKF